MTLGRELQENREISTERDFGTRKTMGLVIGPRKESIREAHLIVKQRTIGTAFILGHSSNAILGTSTLGVGTRGNFITNKVVNPDRTFKDNLFSDTFEDTSSSTAIWTGSGGIDFGTASSCASSLAVYKNNETITVATLTAEDSGSIAYLMSADTGSNFESVTKGITHTFTNTGQELRWRAYSTGSSSISSIRITY